MHRYIDERGREEGKRENTPFNYFKVRVKFLNVMINKHMNRKEYVSNELK